MNDVQVIQLDDELLQWVRDGSKYFTVQKGVRSYTLGDTYFRATADAGAKVWVNLVCAMTLEEWDPDYLDTMRKYYPKIELSDMVTVVQFEYVGD